MVSGRAHICGQLRLFQHKDLLGFSDMQDIGCPRGVPRALRSSETRLRPERLLTRDLCTSTLDPGLHRRWHLGGLSREYTRACGPIGQVCLRGYRKKLTRTLRDLCQVTLKVKDSNVDI